MGAGIAGTAALNAEVEVRLKDADLPAGGQGLKAATDILDERLKRSAGSPGPSTSGCAALLSGAGDYSGFERADLVIEAVFEDLASSAACSPRSRQVTGPDAIFATNTSTIPIARHRREAPARPERVLGHALLLAGRQDAAARGHPARPAPRPSAIATAVRFGRQMGKTVIVVARPSRASGSTASCRPT